MYAVVNLAGKQFMVRPDEDVVVPPTFHGGRGLASQDGVDPPRLAADLPGDLEDHRTGLEIGRGHVQTAGRQGSTVVAAGRGRVAHGDLWYENTRMIR